MKTFRRIKLVVVEMPLILLLMLCDALACAWDELRTDWRDFQFKDMWEDK